MISFVFEFSYEKVLLFQTKVIKYKIRTFKTLQSSNNI